MNAGLPGTGLGGLFYIVGALWMPVDAIYERMRGRETAPWRVIARQTGIALGVIAALWLTGWAIGYLIAFRVSAAAAGTGGTTTQVGSVVRWVGVLGTAGVLALVVCVVQVLRFTVPRPGRRKREGS